MALQEAVARAERDELLARFLDRRGDLVPASQLRQRTEPARLSTGVALFDQLLHGGWIKGGINELCGPRSSGRTALLYRSLVSALAARESVALIDLHGGLDPHAAFHLGLDLGRVLWVRAEREHVLKAADLLLSTGDFGLLALDLGGQHLRVPTAAWQRLQRAAEKQRTALVVSAPSSLAGFLATASVQLDQPRPRFVREGGPLFASLDVHASITRLRSPGGSVAGRPANENAPAPRVSLVPFHVRRAF